MVNPFHPEFMKCSLLSLIFNIYCYKSVCLNTTANSVDPDEMASYKLSRLDLLWSQNYLF